MSPSKTYRINCTVRHTDGNELKEWCREVNGSNASSPGLGQRLDVYKVRDTFQQITDTQTVDILYK